MQFSKVVSVFLFVHFAIAGHAVFSQEAAPTVPATETKPQMESIQLPPPVTTGGMPLMQALQNRMTGRSFDTRELEPQMLSNLLWAAFGINRPDDGKRTAPSAVNFQEIDIYLALPKGLYLWDAKNNLLKPLLTEDIRKTTGIQEFHGTAPVNLIFVADYSRMGKMNEADRDHYAWCDTGFISQNVYLFCASEKLSTVVCGWVDRNALGKVMNLKPEQKIILTQPVGYPGK